MKEPVHLEHFITEDIYLVPEQQPEPKEIPEQKKEEPKAVKVPFAFFHSSQNKAELELLIKIVTACKLDTYQIFDHLNYTSVPFHTGVVFTDSAATFYQIHSEAEGKTLFSKPLHVLMQSQEDKAKLWKQLQALTA